MGPEGPIGGIGGVGGVGGVGGEGDVGPDGPDGPWPTGSPGPDGPWPGDPDYVPGIKPTRRPSHRGPLKSQLPKTYSSDTNYNDYITQHYPDNKSDFAYSDYNVKNIESTDLLHSTKIGAPLYTNDREYEYGSKSSSLFYGKKGTTYNAGEINSLLQTRPTAPSLKYLVDDKKIDSFKQTEQPYDHGIQKNLEPVTRLPQTGIEQISVPDQDEYQKSVFYPTYNLQQQSARKPHRPIKLGRQESLFNTPEQYNNSANVDNKAISNVPFQSDGHIAVLEKQVNARLEQPFQANPGLDAIGVQPPSSINVKPFPLPIGPDPQACPCYLVESNNSINVSTSTTPTSVIGQFGFIPVIFVPYCPGDETDSSKMKVMFPSATPVPYACNACGTQDSNFGIQVLDVNQLGNVDYLKEVLSQANLGFLNVPVKTGPERRRNRSRKTE